MSDPRRRILVAGASAGIGSALVRALAADGHFERTRQLAEGGGMPMEVPVECVRFLLSAAAAGLTGRTIAANFDPWRSPGFREYLADVMTSELYTMRRLNPVHLPDGPLKERLR